MRNVKKLWKWLSPYKLRLLWTTLLAVTDSVAMVLAALTVANILNAIVQLDQAAFVRASVLSTAFFGLGIITTYLYNANVAILNESVVADIRRASLKAFEQSGFQTFHKDKSENYAASMVTELDIISTRSLSSFFKIVSNVSNLVASIIGLTYLHISLVIISFVLATLMFTIPGLFQKRMQEMAQKVADSNSTLLVKMSHWLAGFSILNDYDAKQLLREQLTAPIDDVKAVKIADGKLAAIVSAVSMMLSMFAQIGMIVFTGLLALKQLVPAGAILSTGNLAGMIFGPLSALTVYISQFQSGFGTLDKIEAMIAQLKGQPTGQVAQLGDTNAITIQSRDLLVTFDDGRMVQLPNLSLVGKRHYAIVGPSGIGKSVFLGLLSKNIHQYEGHLQLNHQEVNELTERSVKDLIAYVPQSTYIFNLSAKENILLGNTDISPEHYQAVVARAGLDSVFASWPQGDATLIGDAHHSISGGQAQRIGIARALLSAKPIMLLDEVTANLDRTTAHEIEKTIHAFDDRLTISVTHHLDETNQAFYDEVIDFCHEAKV
ncbi:ATP-binding cassette domain-containing protein [Tuanshanicoccus lijuaniae]|uniref:ATP-binding cassette domain-containing protein n=1 Tax=Aerococcaceae bacterium zg-1292 TaxID=2774330 RepID=UPI001BD8616C|nr:ABC transporter ATP-binding protein [Aerococcaceae bacterium zg-A91]MBS4458822.1 ABC transporter ATP-binding protein [Aerococcaceae bacterium zg-BR33]